jgi:hypothetical protein
MLVTTIKRFYTFVLLALFGTSTLVATTTATNTNTVAPTLKVSATIQDAVQLVLTTGSAGSPCAISAGSGTDYQISFGNVNGLGVGTPSCGALNTVTGSSAQYITSYTLTATYSGFTTYSSAAVTLTTAGFTHSALLSLNEAATSGGTYTTIPSSGTTLSIATTTSGTAITRYLGLTVQNTNGAGAFQGADSAIVTFTLTVQ